MHDKASSALHFTNNKKKDFFVVVSWLMLYKYFSTYAIIAHTGFCWPLLKFVIKDTHTFFTYFYRIEYPLIYIYMDTRSSVIDI